MTINETSLERGWSYIGDDMEKRDIVIAENPGNPLRCGGGVYPRAIVLKVDPQVLVSDSGDMRWSCYDGPLKVVGKISWLKYMILWFKRHKN